MFEFVPSITNTNPAQDTEPSEQFQGETNAKRIMEPAVRAVMKFKDRDSPPLLNNNSPIGHVAAAKGQGMGCNTEQ